MTILIVETAVKGLAILFVAAIAAKAVSRKSAAVRHLVWSSAMLGLLAIPILTASLPNWQVAVPGISVPDISFFSTSRPVQQDVVTAEAFDGGIASPTEVHGATADLSIASGPEVAPNVTAGKVAGATPGSALPSDAGVAGPSRFAAFPLLIAIWGVGFLILLFDILRGHLAAFRATRRANIAVDERLLRQLAASCNALGIRDDIDVRLSGDVAVPCTWGVRIPSISWARPTVLLPTASLDWDDDRLRMVMAHELGHVKRMDWVTQCLTYLACAVHWFNPLAWSARARLLQEQEAATDDLVLQLGSRAHEYASSLLDIARASACFRPRIGGLTSATIAMSRPTSLEKRLVAILDAQLERSAIYGRRVLGTAAVVVLLAAPLAAFHPAPVESLDTGTQWSPLTGTTLTTPEQDLVPERVPAPEPESVASITPPERSAPASNNDGRDPAVHVQEAPVADVIPENVERSASPDSNKVRVLLQALANEEDAEVRLYLVRILGEMENALAVAPMADLLGSDESPDVREHAAWALGEIGDPSAISALRSALSAEQSEDVRRKVLWALAELNAHESVSAIETALANDPSVDIREMAAWALGGFEAESSAESLENALRDESASVRRKAAWALGEIGLDRSVGALTSALRDDDDEVRETSAWALAEIGSMTAADALVGALTDESAGVRRHVIRAIGEIGANDAADALLEILQHDADREVRKMAAYALGQLDF